MPHALPHCPLQAASRTLWRAFRGKPGCALGRRRCVASALLVAAACAQAMASEPALGTLFYSPAERAAVLRERRGTVADAPATSLNLSGVVKRARGKSTAWINRQPLPEGQLAPGSRSTRNCATGVSVDGSRLRVGETLDTETRVRTDIVAPGALRVQEQR